MLRGLAMQFPTVHGFWKSTWLLPALTGLAGCGSVPQTVYVDRPIEVPVPFVQTIDPRLTADCEPRTDVPQAGRLTVAQVLDRLGAVEDALALCRNQVAEIRAGK